MQALRTISEDTQKLGKIATHQGASDERKEAIRLTRKGRSAYNQKDYEKAERYFRRAVEEDSGYALACTYLGHTLYKQGLAQKAVEWWQRAIDVDPRSEAAAKAQKKIQHIAKLGQLTQENFLDR